jgi:hypothetical protein
MPDVPEVPAPGAAQEPLLTVGTIVSLLLVFKA